MKIFHSITAAIFLALALASPPNGASAQAVMNSAQQHCTEHTQCTLVSLTCGDACASVPVNLEAKAALEPALRQQCGGTLPEETDMICHMHPPMQAVCMNNRCTIDYAFENHASSGDFQKQPASAPTKGADAPEPALQQE